MLSSDEINTLSNRTREIYPELLKDYDRFIENGTNPSLFQWLTSKGTSFDCYVRFVNETNVSDVKNLNDRIEQFRIVFYAFLRPFQSSFFYWTLLLFIMYKFNFKRPILKLIFYHYTLRAMGDIVDQLGKLLPYYHSIDPKTGICTSSYSYTEQHPLRWFLTRQINSFFWYSGEIIGDWYPLLRTKPVVKKRSSLILLYGSCIIYNLSKLAVPISQLFVSPAKLYEVGGRYNDNYVNKYYNYYWFLQAVISFTTFVYEFVIYRILNKELFSKSTQEYGFLKKFRSVSEYRIIVSALVAIIAFPILFSVSAIKIYFFYSDKEEVNCSVEDFRTVVTNVQYMIIFIDQILLLNTKYVSKNGIPSYSEINSSNVDYNTGILHSQDTNVKKIVFNEDSDKTDYYDGIASPNETYYNKSFNNYPIKYNNRLNNYPLNNYNH